MIKVGIVGCGKIADDHVAQIERIKNAKIVGVCDKEELMADQLCQRFEIKNRYSDLSKLISQAKPDVIHITTPPQAHFELAKTCLDHGINVYVEKPFTITYLEAEKLIAIAKKKNLKITAGHDDQFTHAARRMRELIKRGYIGGKPIHMESYYCYDLGDPQYAKALLGDKKHWVRSLPGTLMQNNISHGISRIAEYMKSEDPEVIAIGTISPFLKKLGENSIVDEVRVIISNNYDTTGYFTFSTQIRPTLKQFRVFGKKNGILIDHDQQTMVKLRGKKYKSYLEKFIPGCEYAYNYASSSLRNLYQFMRNDFHMKSGMKFLIEKFYDSIINETEPPIPYREIILTAKIMDRIFTQLNNKKNSNN